MQRFGEKLRHLREQRGMTIRGLAQALGFANHSYIARIEKGEAKPSLDMVGKVARLFQVSFDQLMDDEINLD